MSDISVVGLGLMGSALANTLQLSGHKITVWNRTRGKMESFIANGADGTDSLTAAVQASPIILICVSDYALTTTMFRATEVADHLHGRTIVQMSSGAPKETLKSEEWFMQHDAKYLDGAILGGPADIGGEDAQILICGNEDAWQRCEPILNCLAGKFQYMGENIRTAATLDLAWLTQRYGVFVSTAHALLLCEAEGVDAGEFAKTVAGDRAKLIAEIVHSGDFSDPTATLRVWNAAHEHIKKHAYDTKINTEFPDFVSNLLNRAEYAGYGEEDIAAIVKVLRGS